MKDKEMKDKDLHLKILEDLMGEMEEYEFEKKLKPKMIAIKVEKSGEGEGPASLKDMLMGNKEDAPEERKFEELDDEGVEDEIGARFKKLMKKK